jgi:predicted esterase
VLLLMLAAALIALTTGTGIASAATTGGTGGPLTDRLNQSFTANSITSTYHIYASGIDTSKPVGLLMYADGSGGYGYDHPSSTYLLAGANGLVNAAKKHNDILVVPNAPAPNCNDSATAGASFNDNCWYNVTGSPTAAQKAGWSSALMTKVKGQYPIDLAKIAIGGYSSGAQWASQYFMPLYGEAQSVDLAIMISFGGAPYGSPSFSAVYKSSVVLTWDAGTLDKAGYAGAYGAKAGYDWYTKNGFRTDKNWVQGEDHSRNGLFGGIVDRELTQYVP